MNFTSRPLFAIADVRVSTVDKLAIEGEMPVRLCNYTDVYKNQVVNPNLDLMDATATPDEIRRFRLSVGDTVFTKDSETADDIGVPAFVNGSADDFVCGYHLAIARPDPARVYPRYLYWWLSSRDAARLWEVRSSGVTRVGLRQSDITHFPVPMPTEIDQQRTIAEFLDRETAQIDAMIAAQGDLVIRLAERRGSMISSHVGDGEGARRVQLRRVLRVSDGLVDPTKSPWNDMPLIAPNHIESGTGRLVEAVDSAAEQSASSGKGYVRAGQVIYSKIRPALNKLVIAPSDCLCSADMYPLIVNQSILVTRFLLYAMLDQAFVDQAVMVSERVAMPKVNRETLAGLVISLPLIERQKEIVAHLDRSTAHIDSTIDAAQASITLMQERRSALISAAVTGRIDPRTGQESTPEMVLEPA